MTDILDEVRRFWEQCGLEPDGGAGAEELHAFEHQYALQLPLEVREYFARLNGVRSGRDGAWDDEMIAFWQLKDVRPLSEEEPQVALTEAARCLAFADYSISAITYAIRIPDDPAKSAPVYAVWSPEYKPVAASLTEFLAAYLRRDPAVLFGG